MGLVIGFPHSYQSGTIAPRDIFQVLLALIPVPVPGSKTKKGGNELESTPMRRYYTVADWLSPLQVRTSRPERGVSASDVTSVARYYHLRNNVAQALPRRAPRSSVAPSRETWAFVSLPLIPSKDPSTFPLTLVPGHRTILILDGALSENDQLQSVSYWTHTEKRTRDLGDQE